MLNAETIAETATERAADVVTAAIDTAIQWIGDRRRWVQRTAWCQLADAPNLFKDAEGRTGVDSIDELHEWTETAYENVDLGREPDDDEPSLAQIEAGACCAGAALTVGLVAASCRIAKEIGAAAAEGRAEDALDAARIARDELIVSPKWLDESINEKNIDVRLAQSSAAERLLVKSIAHAAAGVTDWPAEWSRMDICNAGEVVTRVNDGHETENQPEWGTPEECHARTLAFLTAMRTYCAASEKPTETSTR